MHIQRLAWTCGNGWRPDGAPLAADLVLYFGEREVLRADGWFGELSALYPDAEIMGCSSGSQIAGGEIVEDGISAVAIRFRATGLRSARVTISDAAQSRACGEALGRQLADGALAGIMVLSDGLAVNGTELTRGISSRVGAAVPVSGGLAADGALFRETLVGLNARPAANTIAAIGFYGGQVRMTTGSAGGWSEFGPRRLITGSQGNVLTTLDDKPALDLYERYLGEEDAKALPSSALLYPLKVTDPDHPEHIVLRTVLAVDREARTMTFAGDVPRGWSAQLMRGNVDRLTLGAGDAARQILADGGTLSSETLVLMISCIGRRLLMGQRTIDEVDVVGETLGEEPVRLGFYSYGEICPHVVSGVSEMHNQTMTITALREAA